MILRTRSGDVEHRAFTSPPIPSRSSGVAAGVVVNAESVGGVPAVTAAVRFAAVEVAGLCLETWRGRDTEARRVDSWQSRFFESRPNPQQTRFDFWSTVSESIDYRGNAFIWKVYGGNGRPVAWWALHPDQVTGFWRSDGEVEYWVTTGGGFVDPLGSGHRQWRGLTGEILHIRGFGDGGALFAPSPITRHAAALGAALAKPAYEAAFYENSASGGMVVTFPETVTAEQARQWRDLITETYEGVPNTGKTKVFGGGAKVGQLGLTQSDAQYIESVGMSVQEVARIFGVNVSLLDGALGSEPLSPEHEMTRWLRFGLTSRTNRILSALFGDPDFFGPVSRTYPRFSFDGVVLGDVQTQETIDHQQIQDGRVLVDEWRARHGMDPLPGGVGMIPQITPTGAAPNPNVNHPPGVPADGDTED